VIYVGLDDTDIKGSPGTNQLARAILKRLGPMAEGSAICRHQLLFDPRVPYTSKNGSASITLPRATRADLAALTNEIRDVMRGWFIAGSDPGLCLTDVVPDELGTFGRHCQQEIVDQQEARALASRLGVHLEGLGGTEQGVIGALAAVGLVAGGDDGRVVHLAAWPYPDDLTGPCEVAALRARGVEEIRRADSNELVTTGPIDIKHLRPNMRHGRIVLFVEPSTDGGSPWRAVKLP